jgi:hypothetical protein
MVGELRSRGRLLAAGLPLRPAVRISP